MLTHAPFISPPVAARPWCVHPPSEHHPSPSPPVLGQGGAGKTPSPRTCCPPPRLPGAHSPSLSTILLSPPPGPAPQLGQVVAENIFRIDSKFWLRLATRNDAASSQEDKDRLQRLATTSMVLVDAMLRKSEQQLSDSKRMLQDILSAAADAKGEWYLPLTRDQVGRTKSGSPGRRSRFFGGSLLNWRIAHRDFVSGDSGAFNSYHGQLDAPKIHRKCREFGRKTRETSSIFWCWGLQLNFIPFKTIKIGDISLTRVPGHVQPVGRPCGTWMHYAMRDVKDMAQQMGYHSLE